MSTMSSAVGRATHPLQIIHDSLVAANLATVLQEPLQDPHLVEAMAHMSKVTLADLQLDQHIISSLKHGMALTIANNPKFAITAFVLPKHFCMTLHDHPHMTVCSKLLLGSAKVRCFTGKLVQGHLEAALVTDTVKTNRDEPWHLSPSIANYHEMSMLEDTVMLDLLLPPYDDVQRVCSFYTAEPQDAQAAEPQGQAVGQRYRLRPMTSAELNRVVLPYSSPYNGFVPKLR